MYQISIESRDYSRWEIQSLNDYIINDYLPIDFHPSQYHLFHQDIFSYSESTNSIKIEQSNARKSYFPAILLLNKTYGSVKGTKKMYYKCIPNDNHYPCFLVAYELSMKSFHKKITNLYVLICFKEWNTKHPIGIIDRVIGPIDNMTHLYDYEIFCKKLENPTMRKFVKEVNSLTQIDNTEEIPESKYIFSIDPEDCKDYDDAFSIDFVENTNIIKLCIYISNVPYCLDKINVWNYIEQVSTIYLPHKKKTMLPTLLSDQLYSLQSNQWRNVFVMELTIRNEYQIDFDFYQRCAKISENFIYDEPKLIHHPKYQLLFQTTQLLRQQNPYMTEINDSHDVVTYLMIMMNHQIGSRLQRGIFRCTRERTTATTPNIPENIFSEWSSNEGIYLDYSHNETPIPTHHSLKLTHYTHITSPIRRLVDIINLILFQQQYGILSFSILANQFVENWMNRISYINEQTLYIKQLQNKCNLFHFLRNKSTIEGIILSQDTTNHTISLYIQSIRRILVTKLLADVSLHKTYIFNVHLFEDQHSMKQKIRLNI
jgi:hypothetical protein